MEVTVLFTKTHIHSLHSLFHVIRVRSAHPGAGGTEKVEQILAFLEIIDSRVRKLSQRRELVFVDSAAGNCYVSFLAYYYYRVLCGRRITIHCIDSDSRLTERSANVASDLGFCEIHFHSGDILDLPEVPNVDIAYSLHACDTATDKALYLGLRLGAPCILGVSCCQHTIRRSFRNSAIKGVTRYKAFKDRLLSLVADTMRAHLLATHGYKVDVFEFTSSRHTDKNIMLRAVRCGQQRHGALRDEYERLREGFNTEPELAALIREGASAQPRTFPTRQVPRRRREAGLPPSAGR